MATYVRLAYTILTGTYKKRTSTDVLLLLRVQYKILLFYIDLFYDVCIMRTKFVPNEILYIIPVFFY